MTVVGGIYTFPFHGISCIEMNPLKRIFKAITPYGLVELRRAAIAAQMQVASNQSRSAYHAERRRRIASVQSMKSSAAIQGDIYEQIIEFLADRGVPEHQSREGSVPRNSLEFVHDKAIKSLNSSYPLRALHIGNFVGVSLVFIASVLTTRHPESLVVSIDPNLTHRGIANPQGHVSALVSACGLQSNVLIIAGYSGRKSISNDGTVFDGYDPAKEFINESACEETVRNLVQLAPKSFDLVFLDGNHEAAYLLNELKQLLPLMRNGCFVVLDDVDAAWVEIRNVFENIGELGLDPIGTDGRVGIARFLCENAGTTGD